MKFLEPDTLHEISSTSNQIFPQGASGWVGTGNYWPLKLLSEVSSLKASLHDRFSGSSLSLLTIGQ